MPRLKVLVADDHALIRAGIQSLLEKDHHVIAVVSDGSQAVEQSVLLKPEFVLLDVSMPVMNGFEAAQKILLELPSCRIVFVTMHNHSLYLKRAFDIGARGYVLKSGALEELPIAIRTILDGGTYVSPRFSTQSDAPVADLDSGILTARQLEILRWMADGLQTKEIAFRAGISIKTVDFHRARIMARLGANSIGHLVRLAVERGLIQTCL